MRRSIIVKLLLAYLLYGILIMFFIMTFTQRFSENYVEKQEARNLYREASLISSDYATEYYKSSITLDDFQKQMEILGEYLSADIWVMDTKGQILLDSSDSSIASKASESEPEYTSVDGFNISDFGNSFYSIGSFYGSYSHKTLTVFSPITISYKVRGYVLIHKPISKVIENSDGFTNISLYAGLIIFLGSFLLLGWYTWSVVRPLRRITKTAQAYAKGDFSGKMEYKRNDEIGDLAGTLNYMASEMDKLEEDQRKFVSNVSHDFRSPLTSIKGYVEAMLDGTIPVEFQEKYLKIILFEAERLNKLTQSLLDLNQFGSHGIKLEMTDFDINQMIRMTIMTFEGTCAAKGLTFNLILTGQELYVHADSAKIQQVLYNLIDNATKFSRNNTEIKIETRLRGGKVFVSVKDNGIGISQENIGKIWERFYKIDKSRGRDKKGSGLGLAIVKEIMNAHNENINCVSTEDVGTEFIFTLASADREDQ